MVYSLETRECHFYQKEYFCCWSFFTAGKKITVGTDKAVNCQGKSFSAASMVKKLISSVLDSAGAFTKFSLNSRLTVWNTCAAELAAVQKAHAAVLYKRITFLLPDSSPM